MGSGVVCQQVTRDVSHATSSTLHRPNTEPLTHLLAYSHSLTGLLTTCLEQERVDIARKELEARLEQRQHHAQPQPRLPQPVGRPLATATTPAAAAAATATTATGTGEGGVLTLQDRQDLLKRQRGAIVTSNRGTQLRKVALEWSSSIFRQFREHSATFRKIHETAAEIHEIEQDALKAAEALARSSDADANASTEGGLELILRLEEHGAVVESVQGAQPTEMAPEEKAVATYEELERVRRNTIIADPTADAVAAAAASALEGVLVPAPMGVDMDEHTDRAADMDEDDMGAEDTDMQVITAQPSHRTIGAQSGA